MRDGREGEEKTTEQREERGGEEEKIEEDGEIPNSQK